MLNFKSVNIAACIIFLGLLFTWCFIQIPLWCFIILICAWFLITLSGSFFIQWDYHFKSLHSNPNVIKNQIAITFDDGPHPEFTPQALVLLKQYNAKATFFCIGKHIAEHPDIFRRIISDGHTIGNHTYSHSNTFGFLNTVKVVSELERTNNLIKQNIGLIPQLYRPAFGVTNPNIKKAVKQLGLFAIGWNKRSLDTTYRNAKIILNRVTKNLKKGDVILFHDTSLKSITVLEQLLIFLQEENMESVTVNSLFKIPAYA